MQLNNTDTYSKETGWQLIVEEGNVVSQVKRTKKEIKRKWTNVKSETKKKTEHRKSMNKTRGGPVNLSWDPDETELVVLGILGPTAVILVV